MSDWSRELRNQADTITYKDDGTRVAIWKPRRVSLVGFAGFCALLLILGAVLSGIGGVVYQSDTQNTYNTKITCSNGNVYNATAANAQAAIYSLNNATGWVDFNKKNITLTAILKLGSYCEIRNFNFYLGTNANVTMIMNYDLTNGNPGIYIHDGYLNGNGINQPHMNSSGHILMYDTPHGIFLIKCSNSTIQNVDIYNTMFGGINIQKSRNIIVDDVRIMKAGYHHEVVAYTPGDCYGAGGLWMFNCSNITVSNVIVDRSWSFGIVTETPSPASHYFKANNIVITNCVITNTTVGLYFENTRDILVSNCDIKQTVLKNLVYVQPYGILLDDTVEGVSISNCRLEACGRGICLQGTNVTINACQFDRIGMGAATGYGIEGTSTAQRATISNNIFCRSENRAIYLSGSKWITITGNHIFGSGTYDNYGISLASTSNITISDNQIVQSALHYPLYGVYESGTADYTKISSDNVFNVGTPVTLVGSHSWAMWINGSTAKVGIQNKTRTYWMNTP